LLAVNDFIKSILKPKTSKASEPSSFFIFLASSRGSLDTQKQTREQLKGEEGLQRECADKFLCAASKVYCCQLKSGYFAETISHHSLRSFCFHGALSKLWGEIEIKIRTIKRE
jgi:hypothetical protein